MILNKININSFIKLPLKFRHLKINFEYIDLEKKWEINALKKIEKILNLNNNNKENKNLDTILESISFLEQYLPKNFIKNINFQINVKSKVNIFLKKITNSKFDSFLNEKKAEIDINNNLVILGTDIGHSFNYINTNLSLKESIKLTVYHEIGHSVQYYMAKNFNDNQTIDPIIEKIRWVTELTTNYPKKLNKINKILKNNNLEEINFNESIWLFKNYKEVYADVFSCLLKRNEDIENGIFDKNKEQLMIGSLIKDRIKEQLDNVEGGGPYNFSHLTSEGLSYLKNKLNSMPIKQFSLEEIHFIAEKAIEINLSRIMITKSIADPNIKKMYESIFHINNLDFEGNIDLNKYDTKKYDEEMFKLRNLAKESWVDSFISKIIKINSEGIQRELDLWNAGISYEENIIYTNPKKIIDIKPSKFNICKKNTL